MKCNDLPDLFKSLRTLDLDQKHQKEHHYLVEFKIGEKSQVVVVVVRTVVLVVVVVAVVVVVLVVVVVAKIVVVIVVVGVK